MLIREVHIPSPSAWPLRLTALAVSLVLAGLLLAGFAQLSACGRGGAPPCYPSQAISSGAGRSGPVCVEARR